MNEEYSCFIWGTKALLLEPRGDSQMIDSPRAGGKYVITNSVLATIPTRLADDAKVRLTDWLVEQREAGVEVPKIDSGVLEHVKVRQNKAMSERIKSLISYLATNYEIGKQFRFKSTDSMGFSQGEPKSISNIVTTLMAYSSSTTLETTHEFLEDFKKDGYLKVPDGYSQQHYTMTVKGKIYAEEIIKEDKQKRQCFVAMWFDENKKGMDDVYKKAIKPAIEDAGYKPYRVDKAPDIGNIVDQIIAQIRQSRFIIADFTAEKPKEPRGGVYYEAGFAYGLGLKVIPTCRKDFMKHIHFDTQQLRHIVWDEKNLQGFYEEIYDSIGANIDWSEDVKDKGTSFVGYKPKQ